MPTKKEMKPKIKKPKKKIIKKKKVAKPTPIIIITQKLPKEKCCTDVTKSGEAYTIPIGFSDRLGTLRLGLEPKQTKNVSISTSTESQPRTEISTQTDIIPLKPLAKPISLPYYEEQQSTIEEQTENPMKEKRKYEKRKEGPRRNSMLDLEQRYTAITGFIYAGPNLKAKDFQQLVEKLEEKNRTI
jgi:hypothetical protein